MADTNDQIKVMLSKYHIEHPEGFNCKCIHGARGHLQTGIEELLKDNAKDLLKDILALKSWILYQGDGSTRGGSNLTGVLVPLMKRLNSIIIKVDLKTK